MSGPEYTTGTSGGILPNAGEPGSETGVQHSLLQGRIEYILLVAGVGKKLWAVGAGLTMALSGAKGTRPYLQEVRGANRSFNPLPSSVSVPLSGSSSQSTSSLIIPKPWPSQTSTKRSLCRTGKCS